MKVQIDADRCTGHARCVFTAPELFTDDERGYGQVIGDGTVRPELEQLARRTVQACPERAITLLD